MTLAQLEHRLGALERKFAAIARQTQAASAPDVNAWIDEIHGTFQDDATYRQAARLGRQWRKSQGPHASRRRGTSV
jgi:hypothetical protein